MFNQNQALETWRRQMSANGIKNPAILDELEGHLIEDVQRQVQSGMDEGMAFEAAAQRIGKSDLLKIEFAKVAEPKEWRSGKLIGIACCVFASLYSLVLAPHLFTIHELSPAQRVLGLGAVALTFLSIISWRFSYKYLPAIPNRRVRRVIAIACGTAGLVWLLIFATLLPGVIVPHFMANAASAESIRGSVLIGLRQATPDGFRAVFMIGLSLLWSMTLAAVLGGIAYGLDEAARRQSKENAYV
jgi:hypothetical protein